MKLAYSSATPEVSEMPYAWVGNLDEVLPQIAEIGYEGVEFQVRDPSQIDARKLQQQCRSAGLEITALSTGMVARTDGLYLVHKDADVRERAVDRMIEVLELAADLGVDPALGSSRGRLSFAPSKEQGRAWFREGVEKIVRRAEQLGNRLVLEPQCRLNTDFLSTIGETVEFIESIGSKNLTFEADAYHMALEEKSLPAALIRGARYMTYVQLGDTNRLAPGQGYLAWRDFVEVLRAVGYDGWLSMEHEQKPDSPTAARQGFAFMQPLLTW
jgi:sugar phosphate isomerase/epimerase